MQRSTNRILTTHAGRLPNPSNIGEINGGPCQHRSAKFRCVGNSRRCRSSTKAEGAEKRRSQRRRILESPRWQILRQPGPTGIEMRPVADGTPPSIVYFQQERQMPEFRDFYEIYDAMGNVPIPGVTGATSGRTGGPSPGPWSTVDRRQLSARLSW